ncbi:DUF4336 domain-containing protein [Haladaptatus salinisoli]|uniref:DUF4336 domain-containing protein n=1 Tax=Haladaptatus salinisoli TaxID=2884876 RepID=UPI001D0B7C06|nr:DUF4336 domain-containing protein [Haladaptatus salinisoli]
MLTHLDTNLWICEEPLRFFGFEIGRITTVVRLSSGGLFVQSPARLTPELKRELDDLGGVRFVAPASKLHGHLYMEQYRDAYPDAKLLAAPGLASRRSDLVFDSYLGSVPDPRWSADVDQTVIAGHRWLTEIAFFHRPSRTLVLGDVGYHVTPESPLSLRLLGRAAGVYERVGAPVDFRLTVSNEAALRRSIREVLAWDFDRVIPGHGSVLESGGREAVLDGFDWLLRTTEE